MKDNQKKRPRLFVNIFGTPILIGTIYLGNYLFVALFSVICFFAMYEFNNICKKMGYDQIIFIPYFALILLTGSAIDIFNIDFIQVLLLIVFLSMVGCVLIKTKEPISTISTTMFSTVWIGLFFHSLVEIRMNIEFGLILTFSMFFSVWICDSAAYIFGKQFGEKKIAPNISPKKTWVGSISGLIFALIFMLILYLSNYPGYEFSLNKTVLLGFIFGGFSQFGDLFESKLKRIAKVKDSSYFLQGHGGFLDRFDSLLITAPITLYILNY